ncbi:hypothetical protein D3C72_1561590 [compost metagenome]
MTFVQKSDPQFNLLRQHRLQQHVRDHGVQYHPRFGQLRVEFCDGAGDQALPQTWAAGDTQVAHTVLDQVLSHFVNPLDALIDRIDLDKQVTSLRGRVQSPLDAFKQRQTQPLFGVADQP